MYSGTLPSDSKTVSPHTGFWELLPEKTTNPVPLLSTRGNKEGVEFA